MHTLENLDHRVFNYCRPEKIGIRTRPIGYARGHRQEKLEKMVGKDPSELPTTAPLHRWSMPLRANGQRRTVLRQAEKYRTRHHFPRTFLLVSHFLEAPPLQTKLCNVWLGRAYIDSVNASILEQEEAATGVTEL